LGSHAQSILIPAHASLEYGIRTEFLADLANVLPLSFELECRGSGDYAKSGNTGCAVDNLLCQTVAEVFFARIPG
jgi:hypothetical protein